MSLKKTLINPDELLIKINEYKPKRIKQINKDL